MKYDDGIYEAVPPELLNQRTLEGWVLVEILDEDEVTSLNDSEQVVIPQPQVIANNGYTPPQTTYVPTQTLCHSRMQVRRTHRYLLRKSAESELARLSTERDEALVSLGNHSKMLAEVETKVKSIDELLKAAQKRAESIEAEKVKEHARAEDNWQALQKSEAKVKALEDNMSKVWKAVGDFQMRAILGNPAAEDPQPVPDADRKNLYQRISQED